MAALNRDRNTPYRSGDVREPALAAGAVVYAGGMVAVSTATGLAAAAAAVAASRVIGVAEARADNTGGTAGAVRARVRPGIFRLENTTSADLIAGKDIGAPCYVVDDQTVALTSNSGARPAAGTIFDVDELGVWVRFS